MLGVPSVARHHPLDWPFTPRQGSHAWLQGKAGLCDLPCASPSRWQEKAGIQGQHTEALLLKGWQIAVERHRQQKQKLPTVNCIELNRLSSSEHLCMHVGNRLWKACQAGNYTVEANSKLEKCGRGEGRTQAWWPQGAQFLLGQPGQLMVFPLQHFARHTGHCLVVRA